MRGFISFSAKISIMFGFVLLTALLSCVNSTYYITKVNETVHHDVILREHESWNPEMYAKKIIMRNLTGIISAQSFSLLTELEEIYFVHSNITAIHQDAFKSVPRLKILQFSYNTYLPLISNEILRNCKNLEKFIMGHNKYTEGISDSIFSNLHNLTHIEVTKENKFPKRLTKELFHNSKSLVSIKLHLSNITTIDSEAFKDLHRLQFLSLVENNLVQIGPGALRGVKLAQVYLGWNSLNSFTGKELANLKNLRILDISFNPLRTVDVQQIKKGAPELKLLSLKKSHLSCVEKMNMMKQQSASFEIHMDPMEIKKCQA